MSPTARRPHVQALIARGGELYDAPITEYKGDLVEPA